MTDDTAGGDDATDDTDVCGYEKSDGTPCELPASRPDGRCHHHTDTGDGDSGGRPSKLTYERQEGIAGMIENGHSITAAARAHTLNKSTVFNWMARGEADKQEGKENVYTDFFDRITRARGKGEELYVAQLRQIATENDDTATLMAMLKQRFPESWGSVDRGEQQGGVNVYLEPEETVEIDPDTLEVVDDD